MSQTIFIRRRQNVAPGELEWVMFSSSGVAMEFMFNKIKASFHEDDAACMAQIFFDHDEMCIGSIDLNDQGSEGFNKFYGATMRAYERLKAKRDGFAFVPEVTWLGLLKELRQDPRYKSSES